MKRAFLHFSMPGIQWNPAYQLIRPPRYDGHFILARTKAQSVILLFKEPV